MWSYVIYQQQKSEPAKKPHRCMPNISDCNARNQQAPYRGRHHHSRRKPKHQLLHPGRNLLLQAKHEPCPHYSSCQWYHQCCQNLFHLGTNIPRNTFILSDDILLDTAFYGGIKLFLCTRLSHNPIQGRKNGCKPSRRAGGAPDRILWSCYAWLRVWTGGRR